MFFFSVGRRQVELLLLPIIFVRRLLFSTLTGGWESHRGFMAHKIARRNVLFSTAEIMAQSQLMLGPYRAVVRRDAPSYLNDIRNNIE